MQPRRALLLVLVVALLTGCAGSGASTTVTPTGVPTTTPAPSTAAAATTTPAAASPSLTTEVPAMAFTLTSSDFSEGGPIGRRFSCDGGDVSPALAWEGAPAGTASFSLIVDDPDARGFVHWVLFDLTGSSSGGLPQGAATSPDAPPQGTNGFGRVGYGGPCPPSGTHRYRFTLVALDVASLGLSGAPKAAAVQAAMEGHILAVTTLTGTYTR